MFTYVCCIYMRIACRQHNPLYNEFAIPKPSSSSQSQQMKKMKKKKMMNVDVTPNTFNNITLPRRVVSIMRRKALPSPHHRSTNSNSNSNSNVMNTESKHKRADEHKHEHKNDMNITNNKKDNDEDDNDSRFLLPQGLTTHHQYCHLYYSRLSTLRPVLLSVAQKQWKSGVCVCVYVYKYYEYKYECLELSFIVRVHVCVLC